MQAERSKHKLGTVSFFSNVTNKPSPRLNIFSPGNHRQRPVVEVEEGRQIPYDEWWPKMQRESKTPIKGRATPHEEAILNSNRTILFNSSPGPNHSRTDAAPVSPSPEADQPKCQLLQVPMDGLTVERHRKLLTISPTVSVATLKRAIARKKGGEEVEATTRPEMIEEYLMLVHNLASEEEKKGGHDGGEEDEEDEGYERDDDVELNNVHVYSVRHA